MSNESFVDRLSQAMKLRNLSQQNLVLKTGLSKQRISQYANGVYRPKPEAMLLLSEALSVDLQWLMGYDVPMASPKPTKQILDTWNTQYNPDNKLQLQVQVFELISIAYDEDTSVFVGELLSLNLASSEQANILHFAKYLLTKRGDE